MEGEEEVEEEVFDGSLISCLGIVLRCGGGRRLRGWMRRRRIIGGGEEGNRRSHYLLLGLS